MQHREESPLYRLLATRYQPELEDTALEILSENPEIATIEWPDPDEGGQPFVQFSTPLHYASNDGKVRLMQKLIELNADVNADKANWYRSVLSWAANNARLDAIRLLLDSGASATSLNAVHAAAFGGSSCGADEAKDYPAALKLLLDAGAEINDRRFHDNWTPLQTAIDSGNTRAVEFLRSAGAEE